jgi:hypothetical protein
MTGEIGEPEPRLIFERRKRWIIEYRDKDIVDQVAHSLAATAMRKRDLGHVNSVAYFALQLRI